ncbi:AraC family transcriptional regulator [Microbacterium marinilacus]|uniref:HTH araC/xylS-type domain-containing protein n=1 Tax=Microbacterium marinilacus TaxID=415209 RepID=A0ABP7BTW6_9MICO|nr:AraC family transcriptional regulator [Microbacterium marinilacus]MBY0689056.1 AraC family transcriptional regulator [Microbacterium marinilacus]
MSHTEIFDLSTRSIDQARAVGGRAFFPHVLRGVRADTFGLRLRAGTLGPVLVGTLEYRTATRVDSAEFVDSYEVNLMTHGRVLMTYGRSQGVATATTAAVHGPVEPSTLQGWREPARMLGVKLDRASLEHALGTLTGRVPSRPVRFDGWLDTTTRDGSAWSVLSRRVYWWSRRARRPDGAVERTLPDALMTTLLRAAPHEYSSEVRAARHSAESAARHALVLMHTRGVVGGTVADIAREAGISPRTLEKQAAELWGTTPSELLRSLRLEYARLALLDAAGSGRTVKDVVSRWGVSHLGRFSARYRERYGENPSATIAGLDG